MLPLKDDIASKTRPFVTYAILLINILVFIFELSLGPSLNIFIKNFGATPYYIFHPSSVLSYSSLLTSMFIHAGFMHIFGNMLFLWIFADNVEDQLGHTRFAGFYLLCGIVGTLLHAITSPSSLVPMVGASGAISGVLGAYILLFPRAKILALIPFGFFLRIAYLPSYIFLGVWFLYQFLFGVSTIGAKGGVAYFAHIGGFIAGLLIAIPFRKKKSYDYEIF